MIGKWSARWYEHVRYADEESVSNDERSEISENSGNDENIIDEQFTASDWDDFDDNGDFAYLNLSTEFSESWILLWIYKYQSRFRLSDVAINSLIQFFGQVLKDTDPKRFHNFPSSSHNAKKLLQIEKNAKTYAVCPKCNKLHKTAEISEDNKCKFVEFPKHPMKKYWAECEAELLKNIPVTNGYIKWPHIITHLWLIKLNVGWMQTEIHSNEANSWILAYNLKA